MVGKSSQKPKKGLEQQKPAVYIHSDRPYRNSIARQGKAFPVRSGGAFLCREVSTH